MTMPPQKPTPADLRAAVGKSIRDVIAPGLDVLFCGINPGLYSAATGCHFARPGNRFWPALHAAGFTPRRLHPWERDAMLAAGVGVTNLVKRATVAADELDPAELRAGARRLARKVARFRPRAVAIVGIGAYRTAFDRPRATFGRQEETIGGAMVWVLPNTSGLNANHRPADFTRAFLALRRAAARTTRRPSTDRTSVRSRGTRRRA
ncbi:MAG TPA: G/U mismatch-specific DNA glycosylase [Vicinamibacterales bacterium]|nr:G/U mismatch-specific DNA glycosylase [Vicinamibacterales bacterium]